MSKKSKRSIIEDDPNWHKNAIIYEVHVKAFYDSNGDGIGDFPGLTMKLDHIQELGINTIWLLPFYPSPFRDDGYDISNYLDVHPDYGTIADFRNFLKEAHSRGIRVITELVINHTSDTHPWFQQARRAKKGSSKRNYYVWHDDDNKYQDARIIFTDTETSNWSWDPVAKAYYWHRFFSHQPDLNFENPQVIKKLIGVMRFWLDMGVDGLRLDAIPYLCEREGTNCENLPETHEIIKKFRSELDKRYKNRIFLAEANQWPEDAAEYFGDGDECHMAFHFPLMPRIYMSLALEDRFPIVEILKQTPEIPDNCQWAIFLRNHDELTLEMVTSKERDYMYEQYAKDPRARVNVGIRRRLAPLMEYNRAKIELMNALLLTMPGSPVIYYGDEIGMGDNMFLGDRNGMRTPMQWTPDRNGGFSAADPERLFLPPVMSSITGFYAVNVESQNRTPASLLNWMKRIISIRKHYKAFGQGTFEFIKPANRKILAYLRSYDDTTILCVANLSRSAQPVHIDLSRFKGFTPIELTGKIAFPSITDEPYQLSLAGFGFYLFELSCETEGPAWQKPGALNYSELPVFVFRTSPEEKRLAVLHKLLNDKRREKLLHEAMYLYANSKRWFAGKNREFSHLKADIALTISQAECHDWLLGIFSWYFTDGTVQKYFTPIHLMWEKDEDFEHSTDWIVAKTRQQNQIGYLIDSMISDEFCRALLKFMQQNREVVLENGALRFTGTKLLPDDFDFSEINVRRPIIEQSNTSIFFGEKYIFKIYRQIQEGENPELQMGRYLTDAADFDNIARVAGYIELEHNDGNIYTLGILQEFIDNQSDCWNFTLNYLDRFEETCLIAAHNAESSESTDENAPHNLYMTMMNTLGKRVGKMHSALAADTDDPDFIPEEITSSDWNQWAEKIESSLVQAIDALKRGRKEFSEDLRESVDYLIDNHETIISKIRKLIPDGSVLFKTRHHGDLHLGQVLLVANDFIFIDFEGEPARPLHERSAKLCPLRDVAGILRSFSYAAETARRKVRQDRPDAIDVMTIYTREWETLAVESFLNGYLSETENCKSVPANKKLFKKILDFLSVEKAVYELNYELNNRPDWLEIPINGLFDCLDL
ncbi:MAG: maltose alpha-D-glucosyltransferase / alpha-amylase [Clostridiales bacterium]|jgi:maltose alpha-D-glucosyltransferase/alpha-amylase|nr:maltose alpha-D-glucosyltransferase / alpha-amylase [Clostridiales bacterium]MDN5282138.1 maltose alpha-D-glucosyltransferase / alpha-amylase [Candidatus Ozemobacter sp.]